MATVSAVSSAAATQASSSRGVTLREIKKSLAQDEKMLKVFEKELKKTEKMTADEAVKYAEKNPVMYTLLGRDVFKSSWNFLWKIFVSLPVVGKETYFAIGRDEAAKNPSKLIPTIKTYITSEIESCNRRIEIDKFFC